jgi:hypothetical protein
LLLIDGRCSGQSKKVKIEKAGRKPAFFLGKT